jgi:outer membrane protein OmpA-like peptidoglycan-associated protein
MKMDRITILSIVAAMGLALSAFGCGPSYHRVAFAPVSIKAKKAKPPPPPPKVVKKIEITERVVFKSGSARLKRRSFRVLDQVADILEDNPGIRLVEIQGHTDSRGNASKNLRLSQRRADTVRTHLIDRGIDGGRLVAKGYGEGKPVEENDTARGRRKNRRVEFLIVDQSSEKNIAKGG